MLNFSYSNPPTKKRAYGACSGSRNLLPENRKTP